MIGLAFLMAAPLSVIGQVTEPEPVDPIDDDYYDPYWYYLPEPSGFNYTDGVANGTYVDFVLDEATGTISDYTSTLTDYNYFYPMVYYSEDREDGTDAGYYPPDEYQEPTQYTVEFFETIAFEDFVPNGHPMILGESFVYMGENFMATFSDYEYSSLYFQFGELDGTMTLTVPDGIEISEYPAYYELYDIEPGNITAVDYSGIDVSGDVSYDEYYEYVDPYWDYQWDEVYLKAGNITCSIWVDDGTLEIDGNQIIIHTNPGAYVSAYSWIEYGWTYEYTEPWYEDMSSEDDKGALEGAIETGLVAAIGYLYMNGEGAQEYSDSNTMNDPSFQLEFMNVEQNRFEVMVDSEIETGRIVTLNVNKDALDADDIQQLRVMLDNEEITACGSMEELVDLQDGPDAGYYMVSGNSQNTIFVYVPHFSTHIISVGLAEAIGSVNLVVPGIIAAAFIAVAIGLVAYRGKRNKDEL